MMDCKFQTLNPKPAAEPYDGQGVGGVGQGEQHVGQHAGVESLGVLDDDDDRAGRAARQVRAAASRRRRRRQRRQRLGPARHC
jgi:hypothetical protein